MTKLIEANRVKWDDEKVKRVWDFYGNSSVFDNKRFSAHSGESIVAWAFSIIHPEESKNVDIGCGAGDLIKWLSKRTGREVSSIEGFEFSSISRDTALERTNKLPRVGKIHLIDNEMTIPEGFDIAWMIEVVEHLVDEELDRAMAIAKKALKPGGRLVITTPNNEDLAAAECICPCCATIFHPKQHVRSWTEASLVDCLGRNGFETIASTQTNWADHRGSLFVRSLKSTYRRVFQPENKPHLGLVASLISK